MPLILSKPQSILLSLKEFLDVSIVSADHTPVGSKREFWALSWPLMIAMASSSLMLFVDRLFLSRFHLLALNAAASGGMAYYIFLVLPMSIVSISEVLAGRLHGEKRYGEVGQAVWQMVWFSLLLTPLFLLIAYGAPSFLFNGTEIELQETAYFRMLIFFAPFQCAAIALTGFFIGIGKVKTVTISSLIGNVVNIGLDYLLIFGWKDLIPSYGVRDAAFATGCSLLLQALFLLFCFLKPKEREMYATHNFHFQRQFFSEGIKIGGPSGVGRVAEVIAHFIFFRIVMSVGQLQMTIVAIVQSIYVLCSFINDAGSKVSGTIVSNLLGAGERQLFGRVVRSSFTLQVFYFLILLTLLFCFCDSLVHTFLSHSESLLLSDPAKKGVFLSALFYMTLFFLFDGISWIMAGFLTAAGDTRFILWISIAVHWIAYIGPTIYFIGIQKGGADAAWKIMAGMNALNALIYFLRYKTGSWLKKYQRL